MVASACSITDWGRVWRDRQATVFFPRFARDKLRQAPPNMELAVTRTIWKVALPMFGMGGLLLCLAVFAALNVHKQQKLSSEIVSREVNGMVTIQDLNQTAREIRYQINMFLRVGDPRHLQDALALDSVAGEQWVRAQGFARTTRELELITLAAHGYERFARSFHAAVDPILTRSKGIGAIVELTESERSHLTTLSDETITNDVLSHLRECLQVNQEVVSRTDAASRETAQHLKIGFVLFGICGCVAGLLLGVAIARTLGRSMVQLHISVRSVAGRLANVTGPVTLSRTTDLAGIEGDLRAVESEFMLIVERLHQRERELLRSEQLARVGQLVAGLAHELRNCLMPMKMLVQAALEKGTDGGLTGKPLQVLDEEISRLEHSIQMFLDFAKPPIPRKATTDLREVIQSTLALVDGRMKQQAITLRVDLPAEPVPQLVDRNQLRQLLLNLLLNAMDAVSEGGRIDVRIDTQARIPVDEPAVPLLVQPPLLSPPDGWTEHDAIRLNATEPRSKPSAGYFVALRVADSGPGIPEAMKQSLFEPFSTTKDTGIGLGLSICQHIATAHGGTLRARNRETGGAEFTLYLPQALEKRGLNRMGG